MSEIAIYGGSFNPPTRAHEAIIRSCLDLDLDQVWVMPSGERMDKHYNLRDTDRLWMLDLMREEVFKSDPRLKVSSFELDYLKRPTQTHKTVAALGEYYPDHRFEWVFGADSYQAMPTWERGKELQQHLGMLIVPRSGIEIPYKPNIRQLTVSRYDDLSSTEVRRLVADDQPIGRLVCASVASYIEECHLYV